VFYVDCPRVYKYDFLGVVFGSQTFGKGLVQNVDQLPFQTALKYTVGKYYTPSGRCIQSSSYSSDHERLKITAIHERKVSTAFICMYVNFFTVSLGISNEEWTRCIGQWWNRTGYSVGRNCNS